jgi:hypothetical protein
MIQIGERPLPRAFTEGCPSDPDQTVGSSLCYERQLAANCPTETPLGVLFVSPPPLPFPRVVPGL